MFQDQLECWITCYCKASNCFFQCLLSAVGPLFAEFEGNWIKRVDTLALAARAPRKEAGHPPVHWGQAPRVGSGPSLTVSHNPTWCPVGSSFIVVNPLHFRPQQRKEPNMFLRGERENGIGGSGQLEFFEYTLFSIFDFETTWLCCIVIKQSFKKQSWV